MKYFFVMILLISLWARANTEILLGTTDQAQYLGKNIPNVTFQDERGKSVTFSSFSGQPILLVPFYTHCKSACPVNISYLKEKLKGAAVKQYIVILFSFDPSDKAHDLSVFRKSFRIPKSWKILVSGSNASNELLEAIGFRFLTSGNDYYHANLIVVLSPSLKISKFIQGVSYTSQSLAEAIQNAR